MVATDVASRGIGMIAIESLPLFLSCGTLFGSL